MNSQSHQALSERIKRNSIQIFEKFCIIPRLEVYCLNGYEIYIVVIFSEELSCDSYDHRE